ncbi:aminotransferase-like domain-containing protein [Amycolatopsis sp. VC5-11]|uniref:aminotransferase-like domain-containing protein n=1 Tax=Amycolatopsis sp. VC5-11 TaxID=3120156 RepID=UPI003008D6B4
MRRLRCPAGLECAQTIIGSSRPIGRNWLEDSVRQVSATEFAQAIAGWQQHAGRKAEQVAAALLDALQAQEIPFGSVLPAERAAAAALGVSRTTITEAYSLLREGGLLESRQGSGSRLHRPDGSRKSPALPSFEPDSRLSSFSDRAGDESRPGQFVDLSSGSLPGLPMVGEAWRRAADRGIDALLAADGYEPRGHLPLRESIAALCTSTGVPTDPDQILVTSGSQQALEIISRTWIDDNEPIVVEDPSYRGALEAFRARGAQMYTIAVERDGADVQALERITRRTHPRFVYLLPTSHNPTGVHMSAEKRQTVADLANERGFVVIEDASSAHLAFRPPPAANLFGLVNPAQSVLIGSLSKLFWGGLRVGWIRGPRPMIERFQRAKVAMDLGTSLPSQILAQELLPHIAEAMNTRATTLLDGLAELEQALTLHLPHWSWTRPDGGSGLWVRAPGVDTESLADAARLSGVRFTPGPAFSSVGGQAEMLRLPFGRTGRLEEAVARLAGIASVR